MSTSAAPAAPAQAMLSQPAPVGAVRAEPAGDAFIAPQPMDPGQETQAMPVRANPFAAADVVNAPKAAATGEAPAAAPAQSPAAQGALIESRTVGDPVSPATRSRAQAILARMSGAARALQAAAQGQDTAPAQPQVQVQPHPQVQVQPQLPTQPQPAAAEAPRVAPQVQPQVEAQAEVRVEDRAEVRVEETKPGQAAGEGQPRLTGLDPADRPSNSGIDDDLLDIPAFLRRQAN